MNFKEYIELTETLDESLAIPASRRLINWFHDVFGGNKDMPVRSSPLWRKLVMAYKEAKDQTEKMKILQKLDAMIKNKSGYGM